MTYQESKNLMTTTEASGYLQERGYPGTPKTLEVWRSQKRGPKYKKVGNRVFYEPAWLDEYMAGIEVKIIDPTRI